MALIAVTSSGDRPGATSTAFAWTLTWPANMLLAECSPAGGRLVRGYFRNSLPEDYAQRGLWNLAVTLVRGAAPDTTLWDQTLPLGDGTQQRWLLPGLTDRFLTLQLQVETWTRLAELFTAAPTDVIADVGPIGPQTPFPLLHAADLVVVVMRPTLAETTEMLPLLARLRGALGASARIGLCLIGSGKLGDDLYYEAEVVRRQLGEFALVLNLPLDARSALRLSDGAKGRRNMEVAPLMREARRTAATLHRFLTAAAPPARPAATGWAPATETAR